MANLVFIPNTSKSAAVASIQMEDIPQDVRTDCETVYQTLKTTPGRMHVDFETLAELETFTNQVKAYCDLRTVDGKPAPIRFRKSPSRGMKPTSMDFRITDVQTENEAEVASINESVDAVKAVAKTGK